jgi:hypothetical protein
MGSGPARAEDEQPDEAPAVFTAISPIFRQLVAFSQPADFVPVFEQPAPNRYIREAVLKGETAEVWTQMITVTGAKGLAGDPMMTPEGLVAGIAGGFERACPGTYSAAAVSRAEISGHKAFAAVASCGTVKSGNGEHSETALIVAIKGESDYYTIQWAERAAASAGPATIDSDIWKERLETLGPIRLCPIVPGEKAPYPSCVTRHRPSSASICSWRRGRSRCSPAAS